MVMDQQTFVGEVRSIILIVLIVLVVLVIFAVIKFYHLASRQRAIPAQTVGDSSRFVTA